MMNSGVAKILIVDDERDTRDLLAKFVANEGHVVDTAGNGWEALLATGDHDYNLILLDIMMPGLDGAKFLQILRRTAKTGSVPVVIVTALDREVAEQRIGANLVEGIVVKKDKMFHDLLDKIRQVVGAPGSHDPIPPS
jgi:DNA-binding response OmpR family regulator